MWTTSEATASTEAASASRRGRRQPST
jgi:hypothetical protein